MVGLAAGRIGGAAAGAHVTLAALAPFIELAGVGDVVNLGDHDLLTGRGS